MTENGKKEFALGIRLFGAIGLSIFFFCLGIILGTGWRERGVVVTICNLAAVLICVLLIAVMIASHIAAKRFRKKYDMTVREQQEYYFARQEEAVKDLPGAVRKVVRLRRVVEVYWAILVFLCLAMSFLSGIGLIGIVLFVLPILFMFSLFLRIPPKSSKFDFSDYTAPADYPELHALAHRAAKALGMDGKIRIIVLPDCNAGIAKVGRVYSLQLGAQLLDMVSEEELYQVLLHEFAHRTKDGNPTDREFRLFSYITEQAESPLRDSLLNRSIGSAFRYLDTLYVFEYSLYRLAASTAIETVADRAVMQHGDPQTAANMMAKLAFHDCFEREPQTDYLEPFYQPDEMRRDAVSVVCCAFRKAVPQREPVWRTLLKQEIQPRNATHPIFRSRIQAIGISDYTVAFPSEDAEGAYYEECRRAKAEADQKLYEVRAEEYPKQREERYVKPLKIVEEWRAGGEKATAEEARPVIDALEALGLNHEAEALCDRLLAETENVYATAYLHLSKGIYLLQRYDKGGITHIYRAIELNQNHIDVGLSQIGEYCCAAGWQKELDEYRERSMELCQLQEDVYSQIDGLSYDDNLVADTMPDEMREKIVTYILSVGEGEIERIYLVRKIIKDDFFCSCFVMEYGEETAQEVIDRVMDKIFLYLDTYPADWQFSIYTFDLQTAAAVGEVAGSCVYDASK